MIRALCLFAVAAVLVAADVEAAWRLVAQGKRQEAVRLLETIVKQSPSNADARLLLGSLWMEAGDREASLAQLTAAVRLRPQSAEAHHTLGEAYNAFHQPADARREFERAAAADPRFAPARLSLGAMLLAAGEGDAAALELDRAIALFGNRPDASEAYYLRAKIDAERRHPEKAAAALERAVALRPTFAEAWSDLGDARRNLAQDEQALAAYARAVALAPDDAVARTRLGSQLLAAGRPAEAVPHLRAAARIDPANQSTLNALQIALRRDGKQPEADAVKKQLADLIYARDHADQNLVGAMELNNRGTEFEKAGDLRGAVAKYRAALALQPDHTGILTNLAVALLKLGEWEEGIAGLREASRREPENLALKQALQDALAQAPKPRE